jgi:hypothetical protein
MMKLKIKDVYIYYDYPIIFSAASEANDTFICLFAEETDSHLKYICAEVSPATVLELESNQKDIRAVFRNSEQVFNLLLNAQSEEPVEVSRTLEDITPFLPDEGLFIGVRKPEAPQKIPIPMPAGLTGIRDKIGSKLSDYPDESFPVTGLYFDDEVIFLGVPQWLAEAA